MVERANGVLRPRLHFEVGDRVRLRMLVDTSAESMLGPPEPRVVGGARSEPHRREASQLPAAREDESQHVLYKIRDYGLE